MKYWLIGGAVLFALWAYNDNHKAEKRERAAAAYAACERTPSCWGPKRDSEALGRSLTSDFPTSSPTGRRFFKGYECLGSCDGHMAGYAWAEQMGITDPDRCGGNSQSFIEGCRNFAESADDEDLDPPDDRDSCTPGKYGDC